MKAGQGSAPPIPAAAPRPPTRMTRSQAITSLAPKVKCRPTSAGSTGALGAGAVSRCRGRSSQGDALQGWQPLGVNLVSLLEHCSVDVH